MASMIISLVMSFFIAGLGIAYLGNMALGIGLILLWMMLCLVSIYSSGLVSMIVAGIALVVWVYSFFTTFYLSAVK